MLTMPESMSSERRKLLIRFGAEIFLTPAGEGMKGAVQKAEELLSKYKPSFMPQQFQNSANPQVHYSTTGPEIWNDTDGKVDVFVAAVGTGGTVSGTGRFLKEKNPEIQVIAVEPKDSPVISGGKAGSHKIQGIGAGFIPGTLNTKIIDEIIPVTNDQAFETTRALAAEEGILCGISSGAAVFAALDLVGRSENNGKQIVVILPSTGERYLSTDLFLD